MVAAEAVAAWFSRGCLGEVDGVELDVNEWEPVATLDDDVAALTRGERGEMLECLLDELPLE